MSDNLREIIEVWRFEINYGECCLVGFNVPHVYPQIIT